MKDEEKKHLDNLISRVTSDFNEKVKSETNPSNVLLKGHLLIENILEECLAACDLRVSRRSGFYEKTKNLSDFKTSDNNINKSIKVVVPMLFALNEIRNNLAHDLSFNISEADINKIGLNLGSLYIYKKYLTGHKEVRENLLFILNRMVHNLGFIIYCKLDDFKSKYPDPEKFPMV